MTEPRDTSDDTETTLVDPAAKTQPAEGGRDEADESTGGAGEGAEGGNPSEPIHEA